jgi:orotidine-5'-phosphate decarboxylase
MRLRSRIDSIGTSICAGLDPRLGSLPREFRIDAERGDAGARARAVRAFLEEILDLLGPRVAAVKPQAAFFEVLGAPGIEALEALCTEARQRGLPVILDAKRGDIGSTAGAYAQAYLAPRGPEGPLADAITVNPYLGADSLEPFVVEASRSGGGLFVLVRTSNPGAADLQDRICDARPLWEHVAGLVARLACEAGGAASIGAVMGATRPEHLARARELMPGALLLLPGYGTQGARGQDLRTVFPRGDRAVLVNASRSLVTPWGEEPPRDWREAVRAALRRMEEDLAFLAGPHA